MKDDKKTDIKSLQKYLKKKRIDLLFNHGFGILCNKDLQADMEKNYYVKRNGRTVMKTKSLKKAVEKYDSIN